MSVNEKKLKDMGNSNGVIKKESNIFNESVHNHISKIDDESSSVELGCPKAIHGQKLIWSIDEMSLDNDE
jgi:hypothetical protein